MSSYQYEEKSLRLRVFNIHGRLYARLDIDMIKIVIVLDESAL